MGGDKICVDACTSLNADITFTAQGGKVVSNDGNTYFETDDNVCGVCYTGCTSCSGPASAIICDACSNQFVNAAQNGCVADCGSTVYNFTEATPSNFCLNTCAAPNIEVTLDGSGDKLCVDDCSKLNNDIVFSGANGYTVSADGNHYFNATDNVCGICPMRCTVCFGASTDVKCSSCAQGYVLLNDDCVDPPHPELLAGHFFNTQTGDVEECDEGCADCYGRSDFCPRCQVGFYQGVKFESMRTVYDGNVTTAKIQMVSIPTCLCEDANDRNSDGTCGSSRSNDGTKCRYTEGVSGTLTCPIPFVTEDIFPHGTAPTA